MGIMDSIKGIFGIGVNYREELQKVVDQYPDLKGKQWAYGAFTQESAGIASRIYTKNSYIIVLESDKLTAIPFIDKANKITPGEPIVLDRSTIKSISRSKLTKMITIYLIGRDEPIEFIVPPMEVKIPFKASINIKQNEQYQAFNNFIIPFVDSFNM